MGLSPIGATITTKNFAPYNSRLRQFSSLCSCGQENSKPPKIRFVPCFLARASIYYIDAIARAFPNRGDVDYAEEIKTYQNSPQLGMSPNGAASRCSPGRV